MIYICLSFHELSWGRSLGCWGLEQGGVRAAAGLGGKEGGLTTSPGDYMLKLKYVSMCGCHGYLKV